MTMRTVSLINRKITAKLAREVAQQVNVQGDVNGQRTKPSAEGK
jgi:hypothetical protein